MVTDLEVLLRNGPVSVQVESPVGLLRLLAQLKQFLLSHPLSVDANSTKLAPLLRNVEVRLAKQVLGEPSSRLLGSLKTFNIKLRRLMYQLVEVLLKQLVGYRGWLAAEEI